MDSTLPLVAGLGILAFVAVVLSVPVLLGALIIRRGRERSAPLRVQALRAGASFSSGRVRDVPSAVMSNPLFERSLDPKAYDAMRGELGGVEYVVFDHASLRSFPDLIPTDSRTAFVRRVCAALKLSTPVMIEASELVAVSGGWLVAARTAGEGSASDRAAVLRDAIGALRAATPEAGGSALRAFEGRRWW
jgi:hypothetical protein